MFQALLGDKIRCVQAEDRPRALKARPALAARLRPQPRARRGGGPCRGGSGGVPGGKDQVIIPGRGE